MVPQTRWFRFY